MAYFRDIVHQSFSDFTFLMPGYVGRKFNVQGDMEPTHCGEAIMELSVTFLRRVFNGQPALESMRKIAERYASHVVEGTNMEVEDEIPHTPTIEIPTTPEIASKV